MNIAFIRSKVERIERISKIESSNARDLQRWLYEDFIDYVSSLESNPELAGLAREVLKASECVYTPRGNG